jgi:hypothetical protein
VDDIARGVCPLSIDSVALFPAAPNTQRAEVVLRAFGPVDSGMPVYTLCQYRLHWLAMDMETQTLLVPGDLLLPTLGPGVTWSTRIVWPMPTAAYVLTVRVIRPTGFSVVERSDDAQGNRQQDVRRSV